MKKNLLILLVIIFILFTILPTVVLAQNIIDGKDYGGFIPCAGPECDFGHFMQLIDNVLKWVVNISFFAAIITFSWAGFVLLTSGGNSGKKDEAKKMLTKVVIGFAILLAARLIVTTITNLLLKPGIVN